MERELRPPCFGFFPPASLSDSSLRPQRAEKAPLFATHALRLKARPVYFGGRLEVWLVIVRRNLRRDFGVPCQILWISCAVYFSSAKQALHGVTPLRCFGFRRALHARQRQRCVRGRRSHWLVISQMVGRRMSCGFGVSNSCLLSSLLCPLLWNQRGRSPKHFSSLVPIGRPRSSFCRRRVTSVFVSAPSCARQRDSTQQSVRGAFGICVGRDESHGCRLRRRLVRQQKADRRYDGQRVELSQFLEQSKRVRSRDGLRLEPSVSAGDDRERGHKATQRLPDNNRCTLTVARGASARGQRS